MGGGGGRDYMSIRSIIITIVSSNITVVSVIQYYFLWIIYAHEPWCQ